MKEKITLVDFDHYCTSEKGISFCYVSEDGDFRSECVRINMVLFPPTVYVNLKTVCFVDESGGKLMITGVCGVYLVHDRLTGMDGVRFECCKGNTKTRLYFGILRTEPRSDAREHKHTERNL